MPAVDLERRVRRLTPRREPGPEGEREPDGPSFTICFVRPCGSTRRSELLARLPGLIAEASEGDGIALGQLLGFAAGERSLPRAIRRVFRVAGRGGVLRFLDLIRPHLERVDAVRRKRMAKARPRRPRRRVLIPEVLPPLPAFTSREVLLLPAAPPGAEERNSVAGEANGPAPGPEPSLPPGWSTTKASVPSPERPERWQDSDLINVSRDCPRPR